MTVPTQDNRWPHDLDGVTTDFPIGVVHDAIWVDVYHFDALGVRTTLVLGTDFSVTIPDPLAAATVTLVDPGAAGESIVVLRDVPFTQTDDYEEAGSFPADVFERGLDKLTYQMQQLQEAQLRALQAEEGAAPFTRQLPANRESKIFSFDADGEPVAVLETQDYLDIITYRDQASGFADAASNSADNAAASAAKLAGTSASSVSIGLGDKVFETETDKYFNPGNYVVIASDADPAVNAMYGVVKSYAGTTLTVTVQAVSGSGTLADWSIYISGATGPQGEVGPAGADGIDGVNGIDGAPGADGSDGAGLAYNGIDNPTGLIHQRPAAYNLVKDVYGFGPDRFAGMATGTLVSAGVLTNTDAANVGSTGWAHKFSGVTLTGAGVLYHRTRLRARKSLRYRNGAATLSLRVYHDMGSATDFTLYVRKANAENNFAAVTAIGDNGGVSVASGVATVLTYSVPDMGECKNGIEIELKIDAGAITTKNVEITEWQFETGGIATSFNPGGDDDEIISRCQRHYCRDGAASVIKQGSFTAGHTIAENIWWPVTMPGTPVLTLIDVANVNFPAGVPGAADIDTTHARIYKACSATGAGHFLFDWAAEWEL